MPDAAEIIFLSNLSDLRYGGEKIDATDAVHRSYIDVVEGVVSYLSGLVICAPDVIIVDASLPATNDNYHVLEINGKGPGFVDHHYPWSGQSRDVAGQLIDHLSAAGSKRSPRALTETVSKRRDAMNRQVHNKHKKRPSIVIPSADAGEACEALTERVLSRYTP